MLIIFYFALTLVNLTIGNKASAGLSIDFIGIYSICGGDQNATPNRTERNRDAEKYNEVIKESLTDMEIYLNGYFRFDNFC